MRFYEYDYVNISMAVLKTTTLIADTMGENFPVFYVALDETIVEWVYNEREKAREE